MFHDDSLSVNRDDVDPLHRPISKAHAATEETLFVLSMAREPGLAMAKKQHAVSASA
jgi:hypothetical protein